MSESEEAKGKEETKARTFKEWLLDKHEWLEKTVGAVVLIVEIIALLGEVYSGVPKLILTQLLNLFFLIFIYSRLKEDFETQFDVKNADDEELWDILRFRKDKHEDKNKDIPHKIVDLVGASNKLIEQLSNITQFVGITAALYGCLLLQRGMSQFLTNRVASESQEVVALLFHFVIDLLSYIGAFYLLRCFYVMYLETISMDEKREDRLDKKTNKYWLVIGCLMVFDFVVSVHNHEMGVFVSEFICGVINAVVFILLIARFENKLLDIPPWILCILYIYAILQTCLPLVTDGFLTSELAKNRPEIKDFFEEFSSIVLTCCLVGKVTLSAVLLYVINSKRIFYYFMSLRKIHQEEESYWATFQGKIEESNLESKDSMHTSPPRESLYSATIPVLLYVTGEGITREKANEDAIKKAEGIKRNDMKIVCQNLTI